MWALVHGTDSVRERVRERARERNREKEEGVSERAGGEKDRDREKSE